MGHLVGWHSLGTENGWSHYQNEYVVAFFALNLWHKYRFDLDATHGHMFWIDDAEDFEFFSSNSAGGIQGNGYECRNNG
jgi:hypothetical protein